MYSASHWCAYWLQALISAMLLASAGSMKSRQKQQQGEAVTSTFDSPQQPSSQQPDSSSPATSVTSPVSPSTSQLLEGGPKAMTYEKARSLVTWVMDKAYSLRKIAYERIR